MVESFYHSHFVNLIKVRVFTSRLLIDKGEFEGALVKLWKNMATFQCAARAMLSPILLALKPDDPKIVNLVGTINTDEVLITQSV